MVPKGGISRWSGDTLSGLLTNLCALLYPALPIYISPSSVGGFPLLRLCPEFSPWRRVHNDPLTAVRGNLVAVLICLPVIIGDVELVFQCFG